MMVGDKIKILSYHSSGCNYLIRPVVAVTKSRFCIQAIPAIHRNSVWAWYDEKELDNSDRMYHGKIKLDL